MSKETPCIHSNTSKIQEIICVFLLSKAVEEKSESHGRLKITGPLEKLLKTGTKNRFVIKTEILSQWSTWRVHPGDTWRPEGGGPNVSWPRRRRPAQLAHARRRVCIVFRCCQNRYGLLASRHLCERRRSVVLMRDTRGCSTCSPRDLNSGVR